MELNDILAKYRFPKNVRHVFASRGMTTLYPPQAEAIEKGALEGKSVVLSVPTAAGKTLIAELCMLRAVLNGDGRCLYIAPLKALVSEKYHDFKEKYGDLGISIGQATGDLDSPNRSLSRHKILVATAEKVDSLLRARAKWLINSLSVVVLDEVHFLHDGERGPTLEILTARIRQLNPKAQILALSATVNNSREIAGWLKAELVASSWRPIPLREGVFYNEEIKFLNHPSRLIKEDMADDLSKIVLDTLRGRGQVLVFVNSRRSAQASSRLLCKAVDMTLTLQEKKELQQLAKDVVGASSSATKVCRKLGEIVLHGSAFHHAGLKPRQRDLIEKAFKKNLIKVICSTPTLAAGVNLPARRAVIRDSKRFESGLGAAYIPTFEYKQCAGRAGRPQYDQFGEAVMIAKTASEARTLFERYISAEPEPIMSQLDKEAALRIHILASIAGDYVHDVNDTLEFLSHTFLFYQRKGTNFLDLIGNIFEFLQAEGFIEKRGFRFFATSFGQYTSRLYLDPMTSIVLREGLKKLALRKSFTPTGVLHMLTCCPEGLGLNVGKRDMEEVEIFASANREEFLITSKELEDMEDYYFLLQTIKTTMLLREWCEEEKEEELCDKFGIGPGDIYRQTDSAQWILHAATIFAELFNHKQLTIPLENLRKQIRYGIKEELIELAQLKGVGRIRARSLFDHGITRLSQIKKLSLEELAGINKIGRTLAREILDQISGKSYLDKIRGKALKAMENR